MSQAGSKKREKNMFQDFFHRITPMASQGMRSIGSTPIGHIVTSVAAPTGMGIFVNKAISDSADAVESTGNYLAGDISGEQWKNQMYKNYIKPIQDDHQKSTADEIKNRGFETVATEKFNETVNDVFAPYKNLFSLFN